VMADLNLIPGPATAEQSGMATAERLSHKSNKGCVTSVVMA
jgi:hypothetical protein